MTRIVVGAVLWTGVAGCRGAGDDETAGDPKAVSTGGSGWDTTIEENAQAQLDEGRSTFRYATFGDEAYWGGQLRLHEAIAGEDLGGVGPGVSPNTALSVGLKVDVDSLPGDLLAALEAGEVD